VAEFNRYNAQQILIEDTQLAALRIDGNFRSTNVNAFLRLLENGFPVEIQRERNRITIRANR
jgi:transmembrane sensor